MPTWCSTSILTARSAGNKQLDEASIAPARRRTAFAGALLAAAGTAAGAFGAHSLKGLLSPEASGWWQTAVQYQMWNAIGLVAIAALPLSRIGLPAALIGAGTLVFSGTLYMMALGSPRWFGAITPIGGTLMIAGWLLLAWRARRGPSA